VVHRSALYTLPVTLYSPEFKKEMRFREGIRRARRRWEYGQRVAGQPEGLKVKLSV
jgi:hypothetical protein